jgi:hypothetical protein
MPTIAGLGKGGGLLAAGGLAMLRRLVELQSSYPPPGLAFGEPDDRLRPGIQYAAASRFYR